MHAFIVRSFGIKNGIDFDRVDTELIGPALKQAGFSGGTTGEFIQQGNIRTDMFEQLLIADLVIADISIHNANAFYELGIRHAFRDKRTFLIRSKGDAVPFDLKTDRYLSYDAADPVASLPQLVAALKATWDSQNQDSPVFQLLPGLKPADPSEFLIVPSDFREAVERAEAGGQCGDLQLLSAEMDGFAWKTMGLRLIGSAQFKLQDWPGAKVTWEAVRGYDDTDVEANTLLGTVYQRLDDLVCSNQALERVLQSRESTGWNRAELFALLGRNAKTLWAQDWREIDELEARQGAALTSPYLQKSFDLYHKGFIADRNHYYSGLNALAMLLLITELAGAQPSLWEDDFDLEEEAELKLKQLKALRADLVAGVKLSIYSKQMALAQQDETDIWLDISAADLALLSSAKPSRVGRAYRKALAGAQEFASVAASGQLLLYQHLGVLTDNTKAALANISTVSEEKTGKTPPPRAILFTGHRIDAAGRENPRFPADKEDQARKMLLDALSVEQAKATGELLGVSGGASGGDILFHEVCEELGIATRMYLVLPKIDYIKASVADAGPNWVERFKHLNDTKPTEILTDSAELPRWLRAKPDYGIWQRSNLWMLHSALAISGDDLTLIALWNGEVGDGPGGTEDMVRRAQDRGATFIHLDTRTLIGT